MMVWQHIEHGDPISACLSQRRTILPVDHVVVFGDSLSDIGRKWKQPMGMVASCIPDAGLRMLAVNATGRFSDSKNWTDYMFRATAGRDLVVGTAEESIRASGEFHRLSSRWVTPPGGSRFRFANYAVGGAVGWKASAIDKQIGLTTFCDQVDEFTEDFNAVATAGDHDVHNFLFIVMFGANDIYTDEKDGNVSAFIGKGIIEQCERLRSLLRGKGPSPEIVVAGVGYPSQSVFFTSQLESLRSRQEKSEYRRKVDRMHGQVATLNTCLRQHCEGTTAHWHYFSMREALLALVEDAGILDIDPSSYQTVEHFKMISHKENKVHFADPNDPRLLNARGRRSLFTADQKHPTSFGYEYLWSRMHGLLMDKKLLFGALIEPPRLAPMLIKTYRWQKDSEVHTCQKCSTEFGFFTRKHHCRVCGGIFCDNCTKHRKTLDQPLIEGGRSKEDGVKDCRVCDNCKDKN